MEGHFARWTDSTRTPVLGRVFAREAFAPPEWVGEGEFVATNYEKKMCGDRKRPHAAVLKKPAT
jgi:hypothetical protein